MPELRIAIAGIDVVAFERDADLTSRDPGYRLHINSTGTSVLSTVLEPKLRELFAAVVDSAAIGEHVIGHRPLPA
jgi:hypothetical protein